MTFIDVWLLFDEQFVFNGELGITFALWSFSAFLKGVIIVVVVVVLYINMCIYIDG